MTKFKSKAEKAFEAKLEELVVRPLLVYGNEENMRRAKREPLDTAAVEKLFNQYGSYLELIDMTQPMTPAEGRAAARMAQDLVGVEHGTGELVFR